MMDLEVELLEPRIERGELSRARRSLRRVLGELDASPQAGFLRLVQRRDLLREIEGFRRRQRRRWRDVVQLGIGGSSLGAHALWAALAPPAELPRFHFPDNVDPESFGTLLARLDPRHTLVHVVSKSGGTLETLAQLGALIEAFRRRGSRRPLREHFVVTTGPGGSLREWAEAEEIPILSFPEDVGGRFSVFTASGLLLPALAGIPIRRVLRGAQRIDAHCRADPGVGPAGELAAWHWLHDTRAARRIHVEMIYADRLQLIGEWFRQLWAESLGKGGQGPTPVTARGTTDQHSQIQLYAEGPDDKVYTFVRRMRHGPRVPIARGARPPAIAGRPLADVFDAEAQGTIAALRACGRPVAELRLPRLTPEGLGELLHLRLLQTALAAALYEVNAFDQPGVEAGKRAAMEILGAGA